MYERGNAPKVVRGEGINHNVPIPNFMIRHKIKLVLLGDSYVKPYNLEI